MPVKFWWPASLAEQLVLMYNFLAKIGGYAGDLGLSVAQVTAAEGLCEAFIGAFNSTDQAKQTMKAMTQWRDAVLNGNPVGGVAPQAPVFAVTGATTYTLGVVKQFFDLRDLIVALPLYEESYGDDLGIVGTEIVPPPPQDVTPVLRSVNTNGLTVNIAGSMQGFDAMRVEYAPKGGNFSTVAFLTNTPGSFTITPANPTQPETGQIRTRFIKKNADFGNYSANYPVTVS